MIKKDTLLKSCTIRNCLLVLLFLGGAWWFASTCFQEYWNWPLSLLFGAVSIGIFFYVVRQTTGKPSPFQLVLRLANNKGGDQEDNQTFKKLHARFEQQFPKSGSIRFNGFDTDDSFIWFYFFGPDEASVRHAVLSQLEGSRIRQGSYFLSKATQACASPNDGPSTPLGD